ncbi:poly-beta-1,6-N-acetyl-D-glucosamine N-deacetylase PgaB [Luteimonas huabeiensis]|uniref:poly-beta-1,6-N-acetyl-D-glucosamine N-deacetylase PgaB n=1 Tax=Luteimonas huabeiensis TaxID=1244513 RepID=UPI000464A43A|nr:poly-beta-1,6-N-acetyl-D-glucosamine N-deacetylase PgaB [Luteimonas huabeiensis]
MHRDRWTSRLPGLAALLLGLLLALPALARPAAPADAPRLLVLSYHDVRDDVAEKGDADLYAISTQNLAAHFDWLAGHGYQPVSLSQVIEASRGGRPLPPRPVLLTFDDGLRSVYDKVFPLLRAYGYPALAAVITSYVDLEPGRTVDYGYREFGREDFLTWAQLREMQDSGLVEVASHTHDLHRGIPSNPQGNTAPAVTTRMYDAARGVYETEAAHIERLRADLALSAQRIEQALGRRPRAIVWPYAAYNAPAREIADALGMHVSFDLEGRDTPLTADLHDLARLLVMDNPTAIDLATELRRDLSLETMRALHVDLDAVYDPDPAQQARNLDVLVERVKRVHPSHVFLQAFADPDGNGAADALYFPNRHLPMRADLFNRVAWQLLTRTGAEVYAWMPVLAYELPDPQRRRAWAIASHEADGIYRLDFTRPEVRALIGDLYEDLAASARFSGLLFHDDAYLRDAELPQLPAETAQAPARTRALIDFTLELRDRAERWRPKLETARNMYARPLLEPASTAWFAQRLDLFREAYDYTAVMAMPWMEGADDPERWLDRLVDAVRPHDPAFVHTVFELQTRDWRSGRPIPGPRLLAQLRRLQAQGVRHLAWYPDDFVADRPTTEEARAALSSSGFPYQEP